MQNTSILTLFFTGLLTGGLTCMAVQGGLLATTIAQHGQTKHEDKTKKSGHALPIFIFLLAKLIAYTILGFLLGLLGSFFKLSIASQIVLQLAVAIFMIGTALNLLNVHPFFRYFIIQPPKFLTRLVRKQSKSDAMFAPGILGAFTIFIPCGTTQAVMALAIAAGNPFLGAGMLFAFILGTSPVFFLLGYFVTKLGEKIHTNFLKVAAFAIIALAIFNLNNTIKLAGLPFSLDSLVTNVVCTVSFCSTTGTTTNKDVPTNNNPTITIGSAGYAPNVLYVKAGQPVTIHLINSTGANCDQAFTIPSLNIQKVVPLGTSGTVSFIAPTTPTKIAFMCSMGMYQGTITVL